MEGEGTNQPHISTIQVTNNQSQSRLQLGALSYTISNPYPVHELLFGNRIKHDGLI